MTFSKILSIFRAGCSRLAEIQGTPAASDLEVEMLRLLNLLPENPDSLAASLGSQSEAIIRAYLAKIPQGEAISSVNLPIFSTLIESLDPAFLVDISNKLQLSPPHQYDLAWRLFTTDDAEAYRRCHEAGLTDQSNFETLFQKHALYVPARCGRSLAPELASFLKTSIGTSTLFAHLSIYFAMTVKHRTTKLTPTDLKLIAISAFLYSPQIGQTIHDQLPEVLANLLEQNLSAHGRMKLYELEPDGLEGVLGRGVGADFFGLRLVDDNLISVAV